MKITDFNQNEYQPEIDMCDFENFFNIYKDGRGNYSYNLNENLYIGIYPYQCQAFILQHDMHWPLISYKIYNTTRLAWLLCKINRVRNPMDKIPSGSVVLYVSKTDLSRIIEEINK